jgi:phenylalanyl-tRNA synthetase beta chain
VLSYPFVGAVELDALQLPADDARRIAPRLANPLSEEQPSMRATLLPGLVAAARRNASRGHGDLALFEVGRVFQGDVAHESGERPGVQARPQAEEWASLNGLLPHQPHHVAGLLAGTREPQGWWGQARAAGWADAIEAVRVIADVAGAPIEAIAGSDPAFHPGRCASITVNGTVIGHAGELHPRVIEATGLPERSAAFEVDLDAIIDAAVAIRPAPVIGTQPVAKEDLALVVDNTVSADDVRRALQSGAGELLESVRLFDVYTGSQVPEGRKSLAFALRFRAPDRTLSAEETAAARQAAITTAEQRCGATLR